VISFVSYFVAAGGYSRSSRESSVCSGPAHLDFSVIDVPLRVTTETFSHSSASSTDVLDQTSSTAVRDTDVQFINDSVALGSKRLVGQTPRARTHRVNVTIPNDKTNRRPHTKSTVTHVGRDSANTRPHTKSAVTHMRRDSTNTGPHTKSMIPYVRPNTESTVAHVRCDSTNTGPHTKSMVPCMRPNTEFTVAHVRRDSTNTGPHTKSVVTFQNVEHSDVEPSASSVVGLTNGTTSAADAGTRQSGRVLASADRGEQTVACFPHILIYYAKY